MELMIYMSKDVSQNIKIISVFFVIVYTYAYNVYV